ncbi:MAG: SPOR domain-containing protein [Betaproteobacteria bacterium]
MPMAESDNSALEDARKRARRRLVGAVVLALAAAVVLPMFLESDPKPLGPDVQIQIPAIDDAKFQNRLTPGGPAKALTPDKAAAAMPGAAKDASSSPVASVPVTTSEPSPAREAPTAAAPAETKTVEQAPADTKALETKSAESKSAPVPATVATAAKKQASAPRTAESSTGAATNKAAAATPKKAPSPAATAAAPDTQKNGSSPAATLPAFSLTATVPAPGAAAATGQKAPTGPTPTPGTFVVQLGAFVDATVAGELATKAGAQGFSAFLEPVTTKSGVVQRVRIGPFASRAEADAAEAKLKSAGFTAVARPR